MNTACEGPMRSALKKAGKRNSLGSNFIISCCIFKIRRLTKTKRTFVGSYKGIHQVDSNKTFPPAFKVSDMSEMMIAKIVSGSVVALRKEENRISLSVLKESILKKITW